MAESDLVKSGISGLDPILAAVIPRGNILEDAAIMGACRIFVDGVAGVATALRPFSSYQNLMSRNPARRPGFRQE